MNILAIGAHPDDIEYSCSGTLIKYRKAGHQVFMFIMTKGDAGEIPKQEKESKRLRHRLSGRLTFSGEDIRILCSPYLVN